MLKKIIDQYVISCGQKADHFYSIRDSVKAKKYDNKIRFVNQTYEKLFKNLIILLLKNSIKYYQ